MSGEPLAPLYLVHHHPGRVRLRSELLRDGAWAPLVQSSVEALAGVRAVTFGASSGSVLVEYDPARLELDVLIETIAHALGGPEVRDWATDPARKSTPGKSVVQAAAAADRAVRAVTGERLGLAEAVPLAMLVGAAVSARSGDHAAMPRWDNLVMWSYSIFMDWHRRQAAQLRGERE